jgi:uncharacterized protein
MPISCRDLDAVTAALRKHRSELEELGLKRVAVFGSTARGDARPGSDIDVLVDFAQPVGMFRFLEVKEILERLLGGTVDLVTPAALKPQLREAILTEAVDAL